MHPKIGLPTQERPLVHGMSDQRAESMSNSMCRQPTACSQQAASKGCAGELGACLGERCQAPEGVPAACNVQVWVHDERCQAAGSRRHSGSGHLQGGMPAMRKLS